MKNLLPLLIVLGLWGCGSNHTTPQETLSYTSQTPPASPLIEESAKKPPSLPTI